MDVFGDLSNWDAALKKVEELREKKALDEHQRGLARVLRYRGNPRMTWAVLSAAKDLSKATDALIAEVLAVLVSRDSIIPHRILAAEALGHMIPRRMATAQGVRLDFELIMLTMTNILKSPEAPAVTIAVDHALRRIEKSCKGERK